MRPQMSEAEIVLLSGFLRATRRYLEFGSGGSTFLAASLVRDWVLAVDSSSEWLDTVRSAVRDRRPQVLMPDLLHVDIGPVGDWGRPLGEAARDRWPLYHEQVWRDPRTREAEFCLVDGRFRVACCMQALLNGEADLLIAVHDFASRPDYAVVHEVLHEVAVVENLSVFIRRPGHVRRRALQILEAHRFDSR